MTQFSTSPCTTPSHMTVITTTSTACSKPELVWQDRQPVSSPQVSMSTTNPLVFKTKTIKTSILLPALQSGPGLTVGNQSPTNTITDSTSVHQREENVLPP